MEVNMATFGSNDVLNKLNSQQFKSLTMEQQSEALAKYAYQAQLAGIKQQKMAANVQRRAAFLATNEQLQAAQFNIDSAKLNAELAKENQRFTLELTEENVKRIREDNKLKVGSVRAKLAANGVVVDQGSPLELSLEQARQGELSAQDALLAGNVKARAYDQQAQQYVREQGRAKSNYENIKDAYGSQVDAINIGANVAGITAIPSLLTSYNAMQNQTSSSPKTNVLTSLIGY
jgi:hypothetical protein